MQSKGMHSETSQQSVRGIESTTDFLREVIVIILREIRHVHVVECWNDEPVQCTHRLIKDLKKQVILGLVAGLGLESRLHVASSLDRA